MVHVYHLKMLFQDLVKVLSVKLSKSLKTKKKGVLQKAATDSVTFATKVQKLTIRKNI